MPATTITWSSRPVEAAGAALADPAYTTLRLDHGFGFFGAESTASIRSLDLTAAAAG